MPVNFIQPSFAAGELAPSLYARVDLAKYHIGLKLCRNLFIWPHGGASNRAGTMFVGRCMRTGYPVHLIPFQFNILQAYILEFGHQYMRVIMNGGYVLEPIEAITGVTNANPGVVTVSNHGYSTGDQVFITGTGTPLDSTPGRQYLVQVVDANDFSLTDLDGNAINTTSYGSFNSGATVARVFTLPTPYAGSDVQLIKWFQSADVMTLCHPNYPPCDLTRTEHWIWTLTQISFAPTMVAPTAPSFTAGAAGSWSYSYVVTAVSNTPPDESYPSTACGGTGKQLDDGSTGNTPVLNTISWAAAPGAAYYNIYKANPVYEQAMPEGAMYGYIGTSTGTTFVDTEIAPDFSQSPPQGTNPFATGTISSVAVTNGGSGYPETTTLNVSDVTGTGAVLTAVVSGGVIHSVTVNAGGSDYEQPTISASGGSGATATISNIETIPGLNGPSYQSLTCTVQNGGTGYYGKVKVTASGGSGCTFHAAVSNGVITAINATGEGQGYTQGQSLSITGDTGSGATFSVTVNPEGNYPACGCYFQQRKVFAGGNINPQTIWMTKPADFKNMDISNPSQASDAITATLVASNMNAIKSLVPMNNLIVFTAGGAWMIVGGYINNPVPVTPSNIVAAPQNYVGACDLPPIIVNYDILYVQAKGSIVRDLAYNFFANVYTGTDMSILSNHLFFGHNMERWAYAEQPFYQIWAVRDDGLLLSFTYLKEQDVYAWAHHDSPGNSGTDQFLSVASIPEQQIPGINVDSVYFVVQRTIPGINGGNPVNYVERMNCRNFLTNGIDDVTKAWFVDCGLQYNGNPTSAGGTGAGATQTVSGLDHLNGATVTGLADGSVFPSQVVSGGAVTLPYAATMITVGLPYIAQLQTLCMEPEGMAMQVQDYRKKISAVAVRVADTRGIKVGPSFIDLTEVKMRGPANYMGTAIPLFTGDMRVVIDNQYLVDDDVCIQQDQPLPCTILGVIPEVSIGDSPG